MKARNFIALATTAAALAGCGGGGPPASPIQLLLLITAMGIPLGGLFFLSKKLDKYITKTNEEKKQKLQVLAQALVKETYEDSKSIYTQLSKAFSWDQNEPPILQITLGDHLKQTLECLSSGGLDRQEAALLNIQAHGKDWAAELTETPEQAHALNKAIVKCITNSQKMLQHHAQGDAAAIAALFPMTAVIQQQNNSAFNL